RPVNRSGATSTIITSSKTIVLASIARTASPAPIAPVATIRMAPATAAPVSPRPRPGGAADARACLVFFSDAGETRRAVRECGHGAAQLDQLEELHARARVVAERAGHRAGDGERILLLDAAH